MEGVGVEVVASSPAAIDVMESFGILKRALAGLQFSGIDWFGC